MAEPLAVPRALPRWKVKQGHVLDELRKLPSNWAQCCVTSPPYWGLRDYNLPPQIWDGDNACVHEWVESVERDPRGFAQDKSTLHGTQVLQRPRENNQFAFCARCNAWRGCFGLESTPELYIKHLVSIFEEVRRVLRPDATLWLNLGDSYAGSRAGPQGTNGQMNDRSVAKAEGRTRYQTLCGEGLKYKDLVGIPWMAAFALRDAGWYLRDDIIWHKTNPMPESVNDRPTKAHEYLFLLTKSPTYYYDNEAIKEPVSGTAHSRGTGKSKKMTPQGLGIKNNTSFAAATTALVETRNKRDVWKIDSRAIYEFLAQNHPDALADWVRAQESARDVWSLSSQPYAGAHFATMPEALVAPCIAAGTSAHGNCSSCNAPWTRMVEKREGQGRGSGQTERHLAGERDDTRTASHLGSSIPWKPEISTTVGWKPSCRCGGSSVKSPVVLEPFAGSGTVLAVAVAAGREAYGIELNLDYIKLSHQRIGCSGCKVCSTTPTVVSDAE